MPANRSNNHFFVIRKNAFDIQDQRSIFEEVCVHDSLWRTGRRNDAIKNRNSIGTNFFLRQFQLFSANYILVRAPTNNDVQD